MINNYTQEEIDNIEKEICKLDQYQMCRMWRFAQAGDPKFRNDLLTSSGKSLGDIFKERLFDEFGGFTPEISKSLGW